MKRPRGSASELDLLRQRVAELERALAEPERIATALRESEAQFRSLVAAVPGMIYRSEARAPWRDLFVSENVQLLCGYSATELTRPDGTAFGDLILPEDRAIIEESIATAPTRAGTFDIRYRIRHADGRIRWVHDQGRVVASSEDGAPLLLDGVVADITDAMEAELALRKNEEQYRTLVASVPGAVYLCEVRVPWKDTFMSDGVRAITGYDPADLLRPDGITINDLTLPEDLAAVDRQLQAAVVTGKAFELRYRIRHADGSVRWVYDRGQAAYAPDGTPRFLGGVILDITDRMAAEQTLRDAEERFRTLVDNVPGAVYRCEIHPPYRDLYVSDGVADLTGYPASDYLLSDGPRFGRMTLEEDRERVEAAVAAAVAARTAFEVRYRIRHADGGIRWVSEQGRATYSADGTPLYLDGVLVDVTEEVATQSELREREERLRTIVENEPECVKLVDRDGNLLEMNPAGLRMLEADSLDQLVGRCICPMIVPADEPAFREMIAAVFRGETRTLVFEVRGLRGGRRVLETHSVPLWDGPERHEVRALLGVTRDITARRQAERAREESEERFRTLVGNIPGAVYRCAVQWPYPDIFLSDGVEAITGYSASEHLGSKELTFDTRVLPEDRDRIEAAVAAAVANHATFEMHYRIRHADGSVRWVQETGRATYGPDGTALFLDGVLLDITPQKLAEEALRESEARLVEAQRIAHVGSWELDLRTQALHWSEEIYRIFELDTEEFSATYETFLAAVHPDDREMVNQTYSRSVTERSPYDLIHRLRMTDGRIKYVHERAETRYAEDGTPIRSAGTIQDITERRAEEEARRALEGQLRQAQKMEALGTLAGGIAHDFNNILAAVIGHAELLAQDLAADHEGREGREGVEEILIASRRARDLVQQILTFSRLRERERRLIALEPVVLEALKLLRATLPATIEIRTTVTPEDRLVLADATQVHQVVLNLCTNAAHAMQEHGGVLDVSCHSVEVDAELAREHPALKPGLYMRLSVRDTGHGMDRMTLDRMFDPFFTTKQPGEGTGLGLAVVHGIMQSHDGAITVTSEPGTGTVFNLFFPAIEGRARVAPGEESPAPRGRGQCVLVVDDEPALVRIATRVLERLGYQVIAHTQAADALADFLARPAAFDLVFTDLTMPRMTGLELAREITARRPDLPVILTSGYSGALDLEEMKDAGIRELIGKPFHSQTIAEVIGRVLRSP